MFNVSKNQRIVNPLLKSSSQSCIAEISIYFLKQFIPELFLNMVQMVVQEACGLCCILGYIYIIVSRCTQQL